MSEKASKRPQESVINDGLKKKHKKTRPINYTICIPSTIIANAKSLNQVTQIAYEVAKSLTIYNVSEVVILDIPEESHKPQSSTTAGVKEGNKIKFNFDDNKPKDATAKNNQKKDNKDNNNDNDNEPSMILATLLQYFITPPYLVKSVFQEKNRKFLKHAGNFPTLTTLPFMATNYLDENETLGTFREGISVAEQTTKPKHVPGTKVKKSKKKERLSMTKYVNVGLDKPIALAKDKIPVNVRVTVNVKEGKVVSPYEAYYSDKIGAKVAVGYHVRIAKLFSSVFTESAFPDGYTSAIYVESNSFFNNKNSKDPFGTTLPELTSLDKTVKDNNVIIFLGKKKDFQLSFKQDETLKEVEHLGEFFNHELKIPILTRIEDAILISLTKIELL